MKMRLCLIGGAIILLVVIIGTRPIHPNNVLTLSPHCCEEMICLEWLIYALFFGWYFVCAIL